MPTVLTSYGALLGSFPNRRRRVLGRQRLIGGAPKPVCYTRLAERSDEFVLSSLGLSNRAIAAASSLLSVRALAQAARGQMPRRVIWRPAGS